MPQKTEDQIEAKFTFEPLGFGLVPRYVVLYSAIHASPTNIEAVQNESCFPGMVVEIFDHPNWRQKYDWKKVQICIFFADVSDDGWCVVNRHFENQKVLIICWRPLGNVIFNHIFLFYMKKIRQQDATSLFYKYKGPGSWVHKNDENLELPQGTSKERASLRSTLPFASQFTTFSFREACLGGGNSNIFYFHPKKLGKWSNLTSICFKWVGSTTN